MNQASKFKIGLSSALIRQLNEIAVLEQDGDMRHAKKLTNELQKYAMILPRHFCTNEGLAYPESEPEQWYRQMGFHPHSLSPDDVASFCAIGYPNPHEGNGFSLSLLEIPRDTLSIGGLSVFVRYYEAYNASLREGLIHLRAYPESFGYQAVHFMGSYRKLTTTDHLEVPSICVDGGIRLLSKHRQDPNDLLSHEVYALVRRGCNATVH
ncbi:MAG: hypothetical protein U0487_02120 [Patescibacteria group bacterium]